MKFCEACGRFFDDDAVAHCPEDGTALRGMPAGEDPLEKLVGQVVDGRFRVLSVLGIGGMGAVYRAMQTSVQREVALKVIRGTASPALAKRFMLEARTTSQLKSVHTVTIFDFGQTQDGLLYLAMELLEGEDLEHVLTRHGRLPWREALRITDETAQSLDEAHEKGIVHRDLKPSNIYLCPSGNGPPLIKVLDFGVAKLQTNAETHLTGTGMIVGTPLYMAPEQAQAEQADPRTDLYSLGCVLYEMLTGRPPFVADTALGVMLAHAQQEVPTIETVAPGLEIPQAVEQLVAAMLKKPRHARLTGARELRQRIVALLRRDATSVAALTTSEQALASMEGSAGWRGLAATDAAGPRSVETLGSQAALGTALASRRRGWALGGAGALLAALVAVVTVNALGDPEAPPPVAPQPREAPATAAPAAISPPRNAPPATEAPPAPEPQKVQAAPPEVPGPLAPADPPPVVAPHGKVVLTSDPAGADVTDAQGAPLGTTPLEVEATGEPRVFKLRKRGFRPAEVIIAAHKNGLEHVRMEREKAKRTGGDGLVDPY